ncbi:MAG: tail fiber protein [Terracidiphilus sp.]
MSDPFVGQIQPFGFGFAPRNWAQCNGQTMSISQNTALFSLLGTMYGGNGQTTFMLPNLQSRVPMHSGTFAGNSYVQGQVGGEEQVTLTINTMPAHNHNFSGAAQNANAERPDAGAALANVYTGTGTGDSYYAPSTTPEPLNPSSLTTTGGNQPHTNLQPFLAVNWCIALYGIFPSRS